MNEINTEEWKYPPTISKRTGRSRAPFDYKHVIRLRSDIFDHPVIMMSDLHQHAQQVVEKLAQQVDLSRYVVLSVGDMAGKEYFGSNGDPTPTYEFLAERSKAFYFVQGNHDLPAEGNAHMHLENDDGTRCMIRDGKVTKTAIGRIGGINGIVTRSDKPRLYKFLPDDFYRLVEQTLSRNRGLEVFMTHETPAIPKQTEDARTKMLRKYNKSIKNAFIGKSRLFELVDKYKPKVHVFGHCHHSKYNQYVGGVNYFNVDDRVLIINPDIS